MFLVTVQNLTPMLALCTLGDWVSASLHSRRMASLSLLNKTYFLDFLSLLSCLLSSPVKTQLYRFSWSVHTTEPTLRAALYFPHHNLPRAGVNHQLQKVQGLSFCSAGSYWERTALTWKSKVSMSTKDWQLGSGWDRMSVEEFSAFKRLITTAQSHGTTQIG